MRSFTTKFKNILLTSLITFLAINLSAQQWTPPTGHPSGGQWTFFTAKAQIDGVNMVAGDQLAVFDGAKLVGAFTLTEECTETNMYGNQWIAYEKLDEGGTNPVQGYTPGNAYTFKAWKASTNTVYSNFSLSWNTLVGNGHEHSVFPPTNTYTWDYPELLFFSAPGSIDGYVKELGGANPPIEGASVTIVESGQQTTTNLAGYYQFPTVVAGSYKLAYAATGFGNDTVTGVAVASNGSTTVTDVLLSSPPGTITGTISNADGPIAGASVTTNPGNYSATANSAGVFSVNVPPATYNVTASANYHDNKIETGVVVVSEQSTTKNFTLDKANGGLLVTVFDVADNEPIENATVTITPGGNTGQTDDDGEVSFNNLEAGTYIVNVVKASYGTVNQNANVVDGYLTNAAVFLQDDAIEPTYPANYTAFPGGNPNEPVWTIYIRTALINGTPLVAGDAIAVYDDDLLVGLKYLTGATVPSNEFTNFVSVFSELNNGEDGYQHGNTYTIEAYRAADNSLYTSNVTLTDPYSSGAYIGTTFPYGDNIFSFASLGLIPGPGSLKGRSWVKDSDPAVYLKDVVITATDTSGAPSYTTSTDVEGRYLIEDVVPGVYDITASLYGYSFSTRHNVVVAPNALVNAQNFQGIVIGQTTQIIDLSEGFQFVSTRIQTDDMDMEEMVNDLITDGTLDYVKNTAGAFLRKPTDTWTNNIGNWVVTEGYLFNMLGNDQLSFAGIAVAQNTPITVVPGFQFIAYLPDVSLDAKYAMTSILDDMEYLRASDGSYLRKIGTTWVNNIGTMNPGEGYLLKMKPLKSTNAYTLTYPAAVLATLTTTNASGFTLDAATIGGNITAHGNAAITDRGVYWGTDPDPIADGTQVSLGTGTGSFTHNLTDLDYDVTYYFAAYAVNVAGEAVGTVKSFKPLAGKVVNSTQVKSYNTFAHAIAAAANDDELVLIDDITEATVTINKPLGVDFGNYTLTGDVEILNAGAGTVNLTGNADGIAEWDVTGTLTVNSPGTTVNNSAEFQGASPSIYITAVGVFTEDAEGNWIQVNAAANGIEIVVGENGAVDITIQNGATVASITIDANAGAVSIENNGTITELDNNGGETTYTGDPPNQTTGGPPEDHILNVNKSLLYTSIQVAINGADAGDELQVGQGTFIGDLAIPAGKNGLQLIGSDKTTTTIKGVAVEPVGSWPLATENIDIASNDVVISNFTIESPTIGDGYYSSGIVLNGTNIEISNNDFVFDGDASHDSRAVAIQTRRIDALPSAAVGGLTIQDNTFGGDIGVRGFYGIFINRDNNTGTVTIKDNSFTGRMRAAIANERSNVVIEGNAIDGQGATWATESINGIWLIDWDVNRTIDNVVLTGNTIENCAGNGLTLGWYSNPTYQTLTNIVVGTSGESNTIVNNNKGILLQSSGFGVLINHNTISGNTVFGIENTSGEAVNATSNWWGDALGPYHDDTNLTGTGNVVSDDVTFLPWFIDAGLTTYNVAVVNVTQGTGFGTIQAAIDAAGNNDIIQVAAGSYTEDLSINVTNLRINGPNVGVPGYSGSRIAEATVDGYDIQISASNVTIDGMDLKPTKGDNIGAILPTASGLTITNSILEGNMYPGSAADDLEVSYNLYQNTSGASNAVAQNAIYADALGAVFSNWLISNNTFTNVRDAINLSGASGTSWGNITITENIMNPNSRGINSAFMPVHGDIVITNNTITTNDASRESINIRFITYDLAADLVITGNTLNTLGTVDIRIHNEPSLINSSAPGSLSTVAVDLIAAQALANYVHLWDDNVYDSSGSTVP